MADDIDELREEIAELSAADRRELLDSVRRDRLEQYLEVRGEYMDELSDSGLVGLYPPDSPLAEHCREHPGDPLCWVVMPGEGLREQFREFADVRGEYVDRLEEHGLLDVERELAWGGRRGRAGMPGPGGWGPKPSWWPPGVPWPPWAPWAGWRDRPEFDPGRSFEGARGMDPMVRGMVEAMTLPWQLATGNRPGQWMGGGRRGRY